jgi:hypothetical protein
MRGRLRNWDSKITFFAFADVITSVCGMLIFITLLLATDLDRPAESSAQDTDPQAEQKLQETLREQAEADTRNRRLQELLAAAETAPAVEKLDSDILRLRSQLSDERQKHAALAAQLTGSQNAVEARDRTLGLTGLKTTIQRTLQESESLATQEAKIRGEMASLETQVGRVQSQLLKARQREGQIWLIPDKTATTKEPILVTVAGSGVTIERLDHPEQRRQLEKSGADSAFETYLRGARPLDQYVVFELKPSGIELFQELLKTARDKTFDVGFDALDENGQAHLGPRPVTDEPATPPAAPPTTTEPKSSAASTGFGLPTNATPAAAVPPKATNSEPRTAPAPPALPKTKNWWQRLLEWLHLA